MSNSNDLYSIQPSPGGIPVLDQRASTIYNIERPSQSIQGESRGAIGTGVMAQHDHDHHGHHGHAHSNSDHAAPASDVSDASNVTPPNDYLVQRRPGDFYREGRYFSIWDPHSVGLHEHQFIILDKQHDEARCIHVEQVDTDHLSSTTDLYRTHIPFFKSRFEQQRHRDEEASRNTRGHGSSSRGQTTPSEPPPTPTADVTAVYMHYQVNRDVPEGSFICLQHTHTISFNLPVKDLGFIALTSLKHIRLHYLLQEIEEWGLADDIRRELDRPE